MSASLCSFCTHANPEGSKFCNQCGSPLHLAPCAHCGSVNDIGAPACHQCGAATAPATAADAAATQAELSPRPDNGVAAPFGIEQYAAGGDAPFLAGDITASDTARRPSVPTALAEHLAGLYAPLDATNGTARHAFVPVGDDAEARVDPQPFALQAGDDDAQVPFARDADVMPEPRRLDRGYRRALGVALGMALAIVSGALAWGWWNPPDAPAPQWLAAVIPTRAAAPAPASDGARRDVAAPGSTTARAPARVLPEPAAALSNEPLSAEGMSATSAGEALATLPPLDVASPLPSLGSMAAFDALPVLLPPDAAIARLPAASGSQAAAASGSQAAAPSGNHAASARTRKQAERDAQATQRLIARDLAGFPPANRPPPAR
jgi:hypothetical protein